jgi:hypothetical protein
VDAEEGEFGVRRRVYHRPAQVCRLGCEFVVLTTKGHDAVFGRRIHLSREDVGVKPCGVYDVLGTEFAFVCLDPPPVAFTGRVTYLMPEVEGCAVFLCVGGKSVDVLARVYGGGFGCIQGGDGVCVRFTVLDKGRFYHTRIRAVFVGLFLQVF